MFDRDILSRSDTSTLIAGRSTLLLSFSKETHMLLATYKMLKMDSTLAVYLIFFVMTSVVGENTDNVEENLLVVPDPVVSKGLQWLWQQRTLEYGFKDLTAKAVTALQLANASGWYSYENALSSLAVKQMDIELLIRLSRHHDTPTVPTEIAEFSLALCSLCRDPRLFYSFDLTGILLHHELLLDWEFSISSLAICASGAHVRKRQLRRLLDATEAREDLSIDNLSMVMIALNCIVHDHRNRNLQHYLIPPTKTLGRHQKSDGSFGNLKTTALAVQALQASDPGGHHWNKSAAINFLKATQEEDGYFGKDKDIETTIMVLLSLGPRSLANIKDLNCHPESNNVFQLSEISLTTNLSMTDNNHLDYNRTSSSVTTSVPTTTITNKPTLSTIEKHNDNGKITLSYTLWIGTNSSSIKTINITTEAGSNFYHVMQLAAQEDEQFAFQSTEWPNGHYIHTLAGCKEDPMSYHYWLLYRLPSMPVMENPPTNHHVAPLGVDDLIVKDKDIYLFWYKKL